MLIINILSTLQRCEIQTSFDINHVGAGLEEQDYDDDDDAVTNPTSFQTPSQMVLNGKVPHF
jgi:hypothetical protein